MQLRRSSVERDPFSPFIDGGFSLDDFVVSGEPEMATGQFTQRNLALYQAAVARHRNMQKTLTLPGCSEIVREKGISVNQVLACSLQFFRNCYNQ